MATPAAVLDIIIRTNTAAATAGLAKTEGALVATDKAASRTVSSTGKASGAMSKLGTVAKLGAAAGVAGLVVVLKQSIDQAREAERAHRQTEAVIKSMGNQAGISAGGVEKLANKLSLVAGVDDEAIQQTENLLLTFANLKDGVGKNQKVFTDTTKVVVDMSAALGQSLKSSAIQVGKALNDPSVGLSALRRVGVSFNATQTETIQKLFDSGKQMKAQKLILHELNKEFAGSAAAQADPFDKLKVALENIEESIGKALLPTLAKWANAIAKFINQMNTGKGAGGDFAKVLRDIGWFIKNVLIPYIGFLIKIWGGLAKAIRWVIQAGKDFFKWFKQANTDANQWVSNAWENIKHAMTAPFRAVRDIAKDVFGWLRDRFNELPGFIKSAMSAVGGFLIKPFKDAVGKIGGFIQDIIDVINTVLGPIGVHIGGDSSSGKSKKPVGVSGPTTKKARGGGIGGTGSGDKVRALLEPGEFVVNRRAVAKVGMRNLEALNNSIPRFAAGGPIGTAKALGGKVVGSASDVLGKLPGVGGLPGWIKPAGSFVLAKVGAFIKKKLTPKIPSLSGPNIGAANGLQEGIRNILAVVLGNTHGLSISSGLRVGDSGSFHSLGRAVDLSGSPSAMLTAASWIDKHIGPALTEGIHNPNLSWDTGHHVSSSFWGASTWADHIDHIHLAKQKGGIVGDFARAVVDTKAPHDAALALMMAGYAESGMRDLGYGDASSQGALQLLASTASSMGLNPHDEYGIAKAFLTRGYYGKGSGISLAGRGIGPAMIAHLVQGNATGSGVYSAQRGAAVAALRSAGLKWDKHGVPRIGAAAAKAPKTTKGKKGKAGKTAKTPTGNADAISEAYAGLLEGYAGRMGNINELIGAGNLEALQRYQVGASQNPLLGLGKPSLSLQGLRATTPDTATALGFLQQANPSRSAYAGQKAGNYDTHIHIHKKKGVDDLVDVRIEKKMKKAARKGNRRLPSGRSA